MDESGLMVRCMIAEGIRVFGEASGGLKLSEYHLVDKRFQSETCSISCKEPLALNTV